jgi:hypothetical protein
VLLSDGRGEGPWELGPDLQVIFTPGHTQGHTVLLYTPGGQGQGGEGGALFSGDHVAWDEDRGALSGHPDYNWFDRRLQAQSLRRLVRPRFARTSPDATEGGGADRPRPYPRCFVWCVCAGCSRCRAGGCCLATAGATASRAPSSATPCSNRPPTTWRHSLVVSVHRKKNRSVRVTRKPPLQGSVQKILYHLAAGRSLLGRSRWLSGFVVAKPLVERAMLLTRLSLGRRTKLPTTINASLVAWRCPFIRVDYSMTSCSGICPSEGVHMWSKHEWTACSTCELPRIIHREAL